MTYKFWFLFFTGLVLGVFLTYFASLIGLMQLVVIIVIGVATVALSILSFYSSFTDDDEYPLFIG